MSISRELSNEKYLSIKKIGKMCLYLVIAARLVFLMRHVHNYAHWPVDNDFVGIAKFMFHFVLGNEFVKRVCILFLALYSMYVAIESYMIFRDWFLQIYSRVAKRKMSEE